MNDKYEDLEQYKLKELKRDFSEKGYEVIVRPGRFELPKFLRDIPCSPDLIATSADDNVVVEIKSRKSIKADNQLASLAEAVNSQEKWSFMLVYTNPKTTREVDGCRSIDIRSIYSHLDFIKKSNDDLESKEIRKAYFLLLWSTFEAAATLALGSYEYPKNKKISTSLIRDITMQGLISRSENEQLEALLAKRNDLSHGGLDTIITKTDFKKLMSVCEELARATKA